MLYFFHYCFKIIHNLYPHLPLLSSVLDFLHNFFLSIKGKRNKRRGGWILEENYRGLVIEGPSKFSDEKFHPVVLSTYQSSMAKYNSSDT